MVQRRSKVCGSRGRRQCKEQGGAGKDTGMDHLNIWYFRSKQSGPHYKTSYSREDLYFFPHLITSLRIQFSAYGHSQPLLQLLDPPSFLIHVILYLKKKYLSRPICAAFRLLDMWPSTGGQPTYLSLCPCRKLVLRLPAAISYQTSGVNLHRICASHPSGCEFICTAALLGLENSISLESSPPLALAIFWLLFCMDL